MFHHSHVLGAAQVPTAAGGHRANGQQETTHCTYMPPWMMDQLQLQMHARPFREHATAALIQSILCTAHGNSAVHPSQGHQPSSQQLPEHARLLLPNLPDAAQQCVKELRHKPSPRKVQQQQIELGLHWRGCNIVQWTASKSAQVRSVRSVLSADASPFWTMASLSNGPTK